MRFLSARKIALAIASALALGAVAAGSATASPLQPPDQPDPLAERADEEGELPLIVELRTPGDGPSVATNARRNGAPRAQALEHVPYVLTRGDGETVQALRDDPRVIDVREDVPDAPDLDGSLAIIGADDVQDLGWTGAGTTVAILDTGIDADHPFFTDNNGNPANSRIVSQACYSTNNGAGGTSLCQNNMAADLTSADVDGHAQCTAGVSFCDHGTHVAGIAAGDGTGLATPNAQDAGVAPDAGIIAINVFTRFNAAATCAPATAPCLLATESDQIRGLNRVYDLATANPGWNVTSVNMSIGGTKGCAGDAERPAVDDLLDDLDIVTVTSYGNNGNIITPGCANRAVTVGSTTSTDTVSDFSNRGPMLEIFAPGGNRGDGGTATENIRSSVFDDTFGGKRGTSMAAPHVAGAFPVLREAYPGRTIAQLRNDMTSTGVPITYGIGGGNTTTTPRLNLLAALQAPNSPPTVAADQAMVTVDEGQVAANSGTYEDPDGDPLSSIDASVGSVVDNGDGTWDWELQTLDGPAESQTVTITVTDDKGESGETTFELVVDNVAPSVTVDPAQVTLIDEGDTIQVVATFSDPGILDTFDAEVDWGVPAGQEGVEVSPPTIAITDPGAPGTPVQGTVTASYTFGDNDDGSGFDVTVTVTDMDDGSGGDSVAVTVDNVAPDGQIDTAGLPTIGGVPTIVAHAGDPVTIDSTTDDPGSDDLLLDWDMGDGTLFSRESLVNPPVADPLPSPTVQPRSEPDSVTHEFGDACLYETIFSVTDDDGGTDADSVTVLIAGNADESRGAGYWQTEYRNPKKRHLDDVALQCYLVIVDQISEVFSEERPLNTFDDAATVLHPGGGGNPITQLDRQLLAAWLNFANGAYDLDELVDTDGDNVPDTSFWDVLQAAESDRLDAGASAQTLEAHKDILEALNLGA